MHISVRQIGGALGLQYGSELDTDDLPTSTAARICCLVSEVEFFSLPSEIRQIDGRDGVRYKLIIRDDSRTHSVLFDSTAYATTKQLMEIAVLVADNSEMQQIPPVFSEGA